MQALARHVIEACTRMSDARTLPLDAIRTDGWFDRLGESVPSFNALCDILGPHFFAFSVIVGVRIVALSVDRRTIENTVVEFTVDDGEAPNQQRLLLVEFRRRVVAALLIEDDDTQTPPPVSGFDNDSVQQFIGLRYMLLAPLFGYSLVRLILGDSEAFVDVWVDDQSETLPLETFRARMREHVQKALDETASGASAINLGDVDTAEAAANKSEWNEVVALLGAWPAPLSIFLRTPDGMALGPEARHEISRGLSILGTAYLRLGDTTLAEDVFRVGIQYAPDPALMSLLFLKLGEAMMLAGRAGEAISPLRRSLSVGGSSCVAHTLLAKAYFERGHFVAAYACARRAMAALATEANASAVATEHDLAGVMSKIEAALGTALVTWKAWVAGEKR